jgi:diguanylate cyclase (GGDEF)-like protein/PAS domain S-box-containing protein
MPNKPTPRLQLIAENKELRARLNEAEETLCAIRGSEVDALVLSGLEGDYIHALKGGLEPYRVMVESMNEGAVTLTVDGTILYCNGRFSERVKVPLGQIVGTSLQGMLAEQDWERFDALLVQAANEESRGTLTLQASDGTQTPTLFSMSPLPQSEGKVISVVIADLSDIVAAAEARSHLALIVESSDDTIVSTALNGVIESWNRAAIKLFGYTAEEAIGQTIDSLIVPPERMDEVTKELEAIQCGEQARLEDTIRRCKDGSLIEVSIKAFPISDSSGRIIGASINARDITAKKRAKLALRTSEERFKTMFLQAPLGISLINSLNGRIFEVNPRFAEIAGRSVEAMADIDWVQITHPDDVQAELENMALLSTGKISGFQMEKRYIHPDGTVIWIDMTISPLKVADNAHPLHLCMIQDITARKQSEARIIYLNRVLSVLSGINTLIVRVKDHEELFREACNIAVEAGGFRMAMIVIVDPGTMRPVTVISVEKDDELLAPIKEMMSTTDGMQTTLVAQAIRDKKSVIANNTQTDPGLIFGKQYAEAGVNSMLVLPLIVSDEAVGTLVLCANEIEFFQKDEMKLLSELAGDIAFAIDHINKDERLNYLASFDVLTGLANRSLFLDRLTQYMHSAISGRHKLAIGMIDLERFKNINDSLGRIAGDAVLKLVAEWLSRNTEDANLLARIDADHFAFLVPELKSDSNLARLVENLMTAFKDHEFDLDDATFRIGIKVGIAVFPDDGDDVDTLYANAEAALKKAKRGGDRYLFYTQQMTEMVADKLSMENQLRRAIDNEEFVLYYQPKVNLMSGKVTSAEALIRWNDPVTGLVPPAMFIPLLEETGLIFEVGRWALRKAIEDNMRWRAAGLASVRIAVNVSPLQLHSPHFIDELKDLLALDTDAAAGLQLEITESLIMQDIEHCTASLEAIRALGMTIAIDDFGTGFSSLSYLSKLPLDTLKIDRSFVIEMDKSKGLALVTTIIVMAHALNLKVVAEGVETDHQMRQLLSLNCDEMQGFLFSKPVPAEIFSTKFLTPSPVGNL